MQDSTKLFYRQIADRYVKVVWTHKIQECQADIYLEKSLLSTKNQWKFFEIIVS